MKVKSLKPVINWLFLGYFLIFAMVVIGGITRLTGSGLSMADWKPIMGAIPPLNEVDWLAKFELYKATPEYKIVNNHFSLAEFKSIFWWEFIHRDLGRLIGLIFIVPFILFWIQKRFDKSLKKKMFIILSLGALQGLLGWYMVSSGLDDKPHVSHFRLAAHFITALSAMLYIFWVAISLLYPNRSTLPSLNRKVKILSLVVLLQIIYGAFTAGLKAGFGNYLFVNLFAFPPKISSFINDGPTVLFTHRYLAIAILIFSTYLYLSSRKINLILPHQKKGLKLILITVYGQVILGVLALLNSIPISLGVLHQAGAVLVITFCLYLIKRT